MDCRVLKQVALGGFTAVTLWCCHSAIAQETTLETVVEGLNNPTGIAIQPGTNHVFVADSGAGRVIRVVDGKLQEVITDFPTDYYGKSPIYDIGPLSLMFIDQFTLVVGGGGLEDGEDSIQLYKIPEAGKAPITADQIEGEAQTLPAESDEIPGEGDFYSMANTSKGIYVTCNGDDAKGWIALATIVEGKLSNFKRSFALKEETKTNAPVAITLSPDGYLAIGQMGNIRGSGDSLLTFCDPEDGKILASFETGLDNLTGLAYGPKRGRLFATEFRKINQSAANSGEDSEENVGEADLPSGALVKLIARGEDECEAVEIMRLDKPTSLAFSPEGDLYVTLAGNTSEGVETPDGKLVVIKGLDVEPKK
jgi:hypothetical protein